MDNILLLHSSIRWLILIAGLLTMLTHIGTISNITTYSKYNRISALIFAITMDLQTAIGAILLTRNIIALGYDYLITVIPHAASMILAIITAHIASRWSKSSQKIMSTLIATIISLLFMLAGIREITGNWFG